MCFLWQLFVRYLQDFSSHSVAIRLMKRCMTAYNPLLQRGALGGLFLACQGLSSPRAGTCPALEPVRLRRASSHVQPAPGTTHLYNFVSFLGGTVPNSHRSSRAGVLGCNGGGTQQRQPLLCPSWHHRTARLRTQALLTESDGQQIAVHKYVHQCLSFATCSQTAA